MFINLSKDKHSKLVFCNLAEMKNSFSNWTSVIHRFLLLWLVLISTRLIFWGLNASYFDLKAMDFIYTIPFDLSTIALYSLPLVFIHFFPLNKRYDFIKYRVVSIIFYMILIILIFKICTIC